MFDVNEDQINRRKTKFILVIASTVHVHKIRRCIFRLTNARNHQFHIKCRLSTVDSAENFRCFSRHFEQCSINIRIRIFKKKKKENLVNITTGNADSYYYYSYSTIDSFRSNVQCTLYRVYSRLLSSTIFFIFSSLFCDSVFLPHPAIFQIKFLLLLLFISSRKRRMDALSKTANLCEQT